MDVTLGVLLIMVCVGVPAVRVVRIHAAICAQPADREVLHVRLEARVVFQLPSQFVQIVGREVNGPAAVFADHVVMTRYGIRVLVVSDAPQHDLVHQVQVAEQANRPVNGRLVDRRVLLHNALVDTLHGDVTT